MQERPLCWPPYFFPWPRSAPPHFFMLEWPLGNTVLHAVSCLLGCLPAISNDNNQPSTRYALLCHDCFNVLTNIGLIAFIPILSHACC